MATGQWTAFFYKNPKTAVTAPSGINSLSVWLSLFLAVGAQVRVFPTEIDGKRGDNVTFNCQSSGRNQMIEWYKEGGPMPDNSVIQNGTFTYI